MRYQPYRKIYEKLINWKNNGMKKPLMIIGARQVGKTYIINEFCKKEYKNAIQINLLNHPEIVELYKQNISLEEKYIRLCANLNINPNVEDTIIFFDEIQESEELISSLKWYCEDERPFKIICAGSLLGVKLKRFHSSFPVGKVEMINMFPMDFEEFLCAKGYDNSFVEDMLEHMKTLTPFSELEMTVCMEMFLDYCILGGMPAVVREYIEKGNFEGSVEVQQQLLADYKEDIRKYAEGMDQTRILNVYNHIPVQLAKDNKKFQISKVASSARFRDYRGCIEWLDDAGMVNVCYCLNFPELPLKGNYDETKYKIYFADSGLLVAMLDEEAQEDLRANKNLGVYKGALYENVVGEALVKAGYRLYYYRREDSTLEQDFFVRTADSLIPIEVKAKNGTAKSLRTLIRSEKYPDIHCGIKFISGNIGYSDDVYTFPYFCVFLLKRYLRSQSV